MSWSLAATIIGVLNGIVTFIKSLFGKKSEDKQQGIDVAAVNKAAAKSADIARDTDKQIEESIHEASMATAADVAAVRDAASLQDGADVVQRAIDSANGVGRADSAVRRKR